MSGKVRKAVIRLASYEFWYDRNTMIFYSMLGGKASEYDKDGKHVRTLKIRSDGAAMIDGLLKACHQYVSESTEGESFGANEIVKDMHRLVQTILIAHMMDTISVSRASRT